jgi:hypothetical protein
MMSKKKKTTTATMRILMIRPLAFLRAASPQEDVIMRNPA